MKHVNEKDLEPDKNKAIAFSFTMLSLAFLVSGVFTFADDFTLKWLCLLLGGLFLVLGIGKYFRLRRRKLE